MNIGDIQNYIVRAALQAPAPDNIPPEKFTWEQSRLHIEYDFQRVSGLTFGPGDMATALSFGACLENIVQASHRLAIIPQINFEDKSICVDFDFSVVDQAVLDHIINNYTQLPLYKRHTNRHPYTQKTIPESIVTNVNSLVSGLENVSISTFTDRKKIKQWKSLVRIASEARFQIQEAHEWFGQSLRFGEQAKTARDGLDIATLNLPPGGGLFLKYISSWKRMKTLNRGKLYKLLGLIESQTITQSSMIIAISAKNTNEAKINAGRLMQRVWIALNEQNLAVQPFYVVPDLINRQEEKRIDSQLTPWAIRTEQKLHQVSSNYDNEENRLCMILRVGYAKKEPVRSQRLPIETITSSLG